VFVTRDYKKLAHLHGAQMAHAYTVHQHSGMYAESAAMEAATQTRTATSTTRNSANL
jgi:hypothetical protein